MNNGWLMELSSRKNKLSEISQPHSDMPLKIDLSHWPKIMSILTKLPKRNLRNSLVNMMKLWWKKKTKLNNLNRSKRKKNLQLDHLFYTYFVSLLYIIYYSWLRFISILIHLINLSWFLKNNVVDFCISNLNFDLIAFF